MSFSVLDLFSGIGGFSLATEWAGGRTLAFSEIGEYPSMVLNARWPEVPNLGDITKLCRRLYDCEPDPDRDPDDPAYENFWCPRCSIDFAECACVGTDQFTDTYGFPDVITAGVPCQPTSLVGRQRGAGDERWLWPETLRVIRELQPRFAIMENPSALLVLERGRAFRCILGSLAEIGYDVLWETIPASALGAGHKRSRVWILATHSDWAGLERYSRHGEGGWRPQAGRHSPAPDLRARKFTSPQWYHQSGIQPVVDGLPGGLARRQLEAVGNSLVPQVAFVWLKTISEYFE